MGFANLLSPVFEMLCLFREDCGDRMVDNLFCCEGSFLPTLQLQQAADGTGAGKGKNIHMVRSSLFGAGRQAVDDVVVI